MAQLNTIKMMDGIIKRHPNGKFNKISWTYPRQGIKYYYSVGNSHYPMTKGAANYFMKKGKTFSSP